MVAGLVRDGASSCWGFGRVAGGSTRVPDERTVFEVGSVTKVFTAVLLARLAEQGVVALDEPVRPLLEPRVKLAPWAGREVTLEHLATHTSTMPRASRRMMAKALLHPGNPYRDYQVDDLHADLAAFRPGPGLGREFAYSNLGFGLLGHLLALRAGVPYEDLVVDEVCRPLGLSDTRVTLDEERRSRLAQGHFFGRPVGLWEMPVLAGAGALRSTAADLLLFLEAGLGVRRTPLQVALRTTQEPRARASDGLSIGLAWHRTVLPAGGEAVWHRGETGGMRAFVGFVPERALGLVLLANASAGVDEMGLELLEGL
jgi:CubicO group peptidase (beta-lactamase class C family)